MLHRACRVMCTVTAAAALVLGGCGTSGTGDNVTPPTSTPAPSSTPAPLPSAGSGAAGGGTSPPAPPASPGPDREVSFESGGVTIHGSLRMPASVSPAAPAPAVVLLAGSGPTDRNGDSNLVPGSVGTLSWLADRFAAEGVASLRYDKVGTGTTGIAGFASHPNDIDFELYVQEARDALSFLADQPGVDPARLIIGGHSEGGLISMVLAADPAGAPTPVGVALFSPPGQRYLDVISTQVKGQTAAAVATGAMSAADAAAFDRTLDQAVAAVRAGAPLPADVPPQLAGIFNATTTTFLQQGDRADPLELAAGLGPPHHVLLTCGEKDIQVPCPSVAGLQAKFPAGVSTFVHLPDTDHVLKDIGGAASDGTEYSDDLPFSPDLAAPLHEFVAHLP